LREEAGSIYVVQPFFILDQDLLLGIGDWLKPSIAYLRRIWPRFMIWRTIMVGCAAGEGQLDATELLRPEQMELLAKEITAYARSVKAALIVLKEFPAHYRQSLAPFLSHGFVRVPSLPMTQLNINYQSFDEYMMRALKSATRAKLRKKFQAAEQGPAIVMEVTTDIASNVDELYPLYLQTYERSKLHFEKLTKAYFRELSVRMPDKVRFFVWRRAEKIVAFTTCMLEGDSLYAEYIGLDYAVALDLHLYHYAVRDMIAWGMANGFKWFRSSSLNYEPKLQMRHRLDPLDLYVRHRSTLLNVVLKRVMPLLDPTREHPALKKFPNYEELWA
jgi:hypothetical protein